MESGMLAVPMRVAFRIVCWTFAICVPAWAQGEPASVDSQDAGDLEPLPVPEPLSPPETLSRTSSEPPVEPSPTLAPPPSADDVRVRTMTVPPPGSYVHDGFYFRLALGGGLVSETLRVINDEATSNCSLTGPGVLFDLALGGTLGGGLVLGGALHTMSLAKRRRGRLPMPAGEAYDEHVASLSTIGVVADWYPDPSRGFHGQVMLGAGVLRLSDTADSDYAASGSVLSAGLGHEWWVGPEASLGILARFDWASLAFHEDEPPTDYEHGLLHLGVMATATYH